MAHVHGIEEQGGHHRGHEGEGDGLLLDLFHHFLRLEEAQDDHGAVDVQGNQGQGQGGLVEEGGHELDFFMVQPVHLLAHLVEAVDGVHHLVFVGQYRTLGLARGAGGVHDEGGVVIVYRDVGIGGVTLAQKGIVGGGEIGNVAANTEVIEFGCLVVHLLDDGDELFPK